MENNFSIIIFDVRQVFGFVGCTYFAFESELGRPKRGDVFSNR